MADTAAEDKEVPDGMHQQFIPCGIKEHAEYIENTACCQEDNPG